MNSISDLARDLASLPGETRAIAAEYVGSLSSEETRTLAVELLAEEIDHRRREHQRMVEQEDLLKRLSTPEQWAQRQIWKTQSAEDHLASCKRLWERTAELQDDLNAGKLADDESLAAAMQEIELLRDAIDPMRPELKGPFGRSHPRLVEKIWDGSCYCEIEHYDHRYVARDRAAARRNVSDFRKQDEHQKALRKKAGLPAIGNWMDDLEVIMSLRRRLALVAGPDLLASEFAIGDGTTATWGQATVEQHERRVQWQMRDAAGSMADAERHRAAIRLIEEADAVCLDEVNHRVGRAAA